MDLSQSLQGNTIRVWGRNATVGTALEELYQYDQAMDWYTIMGAGAKLDVTSSSTNDASVGTGARTIRIFGLGTDGNFLTETLTMNGQTIVQSAGTYTDVFGADVSTSGTGLNNAGDIHIVKTGTGGTYTTGVPGTLTSAMCKILVGWSTSMNGHWKAPVSGGSYLLTDICASSYTQGALLQVVLREPAGTDASYHVACLIGLGSAGHAQLDLKSAGIVITPGMYVGLRPLGAAASAVVQANMILQRVQ
jgi:hypothetical protein